MEKMVDLIIKWLRKPIATFITAVLIIIVSIVQQVLSPFFAEILRTVGAISLGISFDHFWRNKTIGSERNSERIKVIEEFTGLRRLGLKKITPERDSIEIGQKDFCFLKRMKEFQSKYHLIIIGLTAGYIPTNIGNQINDLLTYNRNLKLDICILHPKSPCVDLKSKEVWGDNKTTLDNITKSVDGWIKLKEKFPNRIVIKKTMSIPYAEYEAKDLDSEQGTIYYTPITYKEHTNISPSYLFTSQSILYNFHKEIINNILEDAEEIKV
ncbi:MAG: hypothetical protein RBT05_10695 [Bacteroidales bacterium]|jgi:hypothetical protein|nr:hypothetical protein [Bacteroidales bacterium]